ncbi:hypothetical protein Q8A73_013481 [Channa argus]|nr:hypothetical protein Q8A73_013481 [Channa argus]
MKTLHDTPVKVHDIFKALPDQQIPIRVVLTNGVAGAWKTFSGQKFSLDWAEGLENQDVSVLVVLSFRELNLIKDEQYSLLTLLHVFHPTLQKVTAEQLAVCKLLFIFDGLDESRLSLDLNNSEVVSDVTQKSSVNVLLRNLIQGNLLPSALVWITSRPAAANQIPAKCVDRVTEVRGFNGTQKEEYFRRRFSDKELSSRIISHIKTSRSLHIMCHIPVFCWITATVLEHMLTTEQRGELPKNLTDMYSHFLLVQTKRKKNKYDEGHEISPQKLMEADRDVLVKLGRLAFEHLEKGNIMFYQEDLEQCGLDVTEALAKHLAALNTSSYMEQTVSMHPAVCLVTQDPDVTLPWSGYVASAGNTVPTRGPLGLLDDQWPSIGPPSPVQVDNRFTVLEELERRTSLPAVPCDCLSREIPDSSGGHSTPRGQCGRGMLSGSRQTRCATTTNPVPPEGIQMLFLSATLHRRVFPV